MEPEKMETHLQVYQNKQFLVGRCIAYATFGYMHLKKKKYDFIKKIEVKRYLLNETNPNFDPYHYYIELTLALDDRLLKVIIDNEGFIKYSSFKNRFNPKQITKMPVAALKHDYFFMDKTIEYMVIMDLEYHLQTIYDLWKNGHVWLI